MMVVLYALQVSRVPTSRVRGIFRGISGVVHPLECSRKVQVQIRETDSKRYDSGQV